jgi:hypothetical protein
MSTAREFREVILEKRKRNLLAIEDAIEALTVKGVKTYTLDTGQTSQTVSRLDVPQLVDSAKKLLESIEELEDGLGEGAGGSGAVFVKPQW